MIPSDAPHDASLGSHIENAGHIIADQPWGVDCRRDEWWNSENHNESLSQWTEQAFSLSLESRSAATSATPLTFCEEEQPINNSEQINSVSRSPKASKKQKENRVSAGTLKITAESPKETWPRSCASSLLKVCSSAQAQARCTHTLDARRQKQHHDSRIAGDWLARSTTTRRDVTINLATVI
jgi:hypothetical protein